MADRFHTDAYYSRSEGQDVHLVVPMTILFGTWNLAALITMFITEILDPSLIGFGPNIPEAYSSTGGRKFVNIETWIQWTLLLIYTFMSQIIMSQVKDTVGVWIKNRYYTIHTTQLKVQLITLCYQLSKWTTHILYIYVLMTQIDIILASALAGVIASAIITNKHMGQNTRKMSVDYDHLSRVAPQ